MLSLVSGASNSLEYSAGTMVPRVRSPPGDSTITCSPTVGADQVRVLPARGVAHFSHSVVRFGPSWTRAFAPSTSAIVPRRIRFCSKRRMSDRSAFMHGMLPKSACGCTRGRVDILLSGYGSRCCTDSDGGKDALPSLKTHTLSHYLE